MAEQKNGGKNRKALIGIVAAVAAVVILVVVLLCVFVEREPAHTHTYGEWTTVKAATCEEAGERERACPCGEKQTEVIPAAGHTPAAEVRENEKPATCEANGSYDTVVYCGVRRGTQPHNDDDDGGTHALGGGVRKREARGVRDGRLLRDGRVLRGVRRGTQPRDRRPSRDGTYARHGQDRKQDTRDVRAGRLL